jgi:tetratricopeptide (TPR) repeat protein
MNLNEKVIRSASTPVRSVRTFLRSHSAPVYRERKTGASGCANSSKSSQSMSKVLSQELRAARKAYGRYAIECAKIMSSLADIFSEEGDYERALTVHKEASSIYSTKLGDIHFTTIDSNIHVGEALEALGRYDEAIQMYYNVLVMRKELKGDTDSSVADAGILMSRALRKKKGRQSFALKELKRALKVYRASLGDKHPKVSATVDDIASTYIEDGNFSKAALILDEVVKLKAATNGMYNADVANSLMQLGIAQQSSGETAKALQSMKKAYTIYVSVDGENAEQTILTLEHIAGFLRKNKDHKQAINTYMAVLKGKKTKMSDADPSVADTYADLGLCLQDIGNLEKATKCLKQSLTIYLQTSSDVQKVAQVMHNLGIVHQLRGAAKEAVKVFKQELNIRRKIGPSELPQVARSLFYLGTAKYDQNDYPSALAFLTEALSVYEKLDSDLGLDFAEALFSTGLVLKAMRQDDRARHSFLESLKLFHAHGLGNDHELVKMATAKVTEMGHKCECKSGNCNQVPCKTNYGTITI